MAGDITGCEAGGQEEGKEEGSQWADMPLLVLSQIPRCDYGTIGADITAAATAAGFVELHRVEGAEALAPFALDRENAVDSAARGAHIVVYRLMIT